MVLVLHRTAVLYIRLLEELQRFGGAGWRDAMGRDRMGLDEIRWSGLPIDWDPARDAPY